MSPFAPDLSAIANLLNVMAGVNYLTSRDGTIIALGASHWRDFAMNNEAAHVADGLGQNCLSACSDAETRETYRNIYEKLWRGDVASYSLGVRCDSPTMQRDMRLILTAMPSSAGTVGILHQSIPVRQIKRPAINLFHSSQRVPAGWQGRVLKMCSCCQKVRMADGHWIEAEEFLRLGESSDVRIAHGMCEACSSDIQKGTE